VINLFYVLCSSAVLCFGLSLIFFCSAVAAVFSLADKLQPAIIFIDEVDSFLGQRRTSDHEAMLNMKTEFMALWDGFTTTSKI
jgi:SpoVK/Ycf46/Vps4 family AAA+-type ATPase